MVLAELEQNHIRFSPYHEELIVGYPYLPIFYMVADTLNKALVLRTALLAKHSIFPPQDAPITEALRDAMTGATRVATSLYSGYDRVADVNFISHDPVVGLTQDGRIVL